MSRTRTTLSGLFILAAAILGIGVGYRVTLAFALRTHPASPEVSLAAAMAGLFIGGVAAVFAILVVARRHLGTRA